MAAGPGIQYKGKARKVAKTKRCGMCVALLLALTSMTGLGAAKREAWVWLPSRMASDAEYDKVTNIITRAAACGYTSVVFGSGEDIYWRDETAARVRRVNALARSLGLELIPCVWGMGYGGTVTYVDPDTIESTPMKGLRYRVSGTRATPETETVVTGLEGLVVTNELRLALADRLKPFRTYRLTCRVKTENVSPVKYYSVRGNIYHGEYGEKKEQELYDFIVESTQDWKEYAWEFNTYSTGFINLSVAVNRHLKVAGTALFDAVKVEERPLTRCLTSEAWMKPVVRSAASGKVYVEGRDYRPFPKMENVRAGRPIEIELLPGSAVRDGEELLVDAHVPAIQGAKQFSVCPSAAGLKAYWRKTAREIDALLHPRRWFFTVDEWRVANRCEKCRARKVSPGRLMGESIAEMAAVVREVNPKAEVCAWADMFCPLENAGRNPYYCVDGSMLDSWEYLPKDLIMVPWMNGRDDAKSTKWLMEHGFRCIAGGYYNYPDFSRDIRWRDACKDDPKFLGMMFTTWGGVWGDGGYYKLEEYADMVFER